MGVFDGRGVVLEPELSFSHSSLFSSGAPLESFTDLAQKRDLGKGLLYPTLIQQDLQKHWPISAVWEEMRPFSWFLCVSLFVFLCISCTLGEKFISIGSS